MTNNTIPNVPRDDLDLIRVVLEGFKPCIARDDALRTVRALLSAPSPAGVDGLEVAAYIWSHEKGITVPTMRNKPPFWPGKGGYTSEPLCRLSDAHAIIDGLRGEVGAQRVKTCIALKERNDAREERDQHAQRIGELEGLLREVAASLAWNAHGECRAIHEGPIMPSQMALDAVKVALGD